VGRWQNHSLLAVGGNCYPLTGEWIESQVRGLWPLRSLTIIWLAIQWQLGGGIIKVEQISTIKELCSNPRLRHFACLLSLGR
jgi:hypothetical protein